MLRRFATIVLSVLVLTLTVPATARRADTVPARLSDREFWSLIEQLSEPNGSFISRSGSSDNLLSNEIQISTVAAELARQVPPSGVYLGVGPEQNFTYIAAIRPRIAFITDIRRGNMDLHLLYKALFEMSGHRAEFVARLFNRASVPTLAPTSSAAQLMAAYAGATPVPEATFAANLQAVVGLLTNKHGFAITADDRANIEYAYRAFYRFGPAIDYTSSINGWSGRFVTYAALMESVNAGSGEDAAFWQMNRTSRSSKPWKAETSSCPSSATSRDQRRCARSAGGSRRTARPSARSMCRTSNSTWSGMACGRPSARTWPDYRWIDRASSFGRTAVVRGSAR